jgi:hypothetical protein
VSAPVLPVRVVGRSVRVVLEMMTGVVPVRVVIGSHTIDLLLQ